MIQRHNTYANIDWISILIWIVMMGFGWMNIYSANIMEAGTGIFDMDQRFGKQLVWIAASIVLAVGLFILDAKFYIHFAYVLYAALILVLMGVLIFGTEINGSKSWFVIGGFQLQPSEFAKPITALALARWLSSHNYHMRNLSHLFRSGMIVLLPLLLIMLQPDMGSSLVYLSFLFVLFREGFSANAMFLLVALVLLFMAILLLEKAAILLLIVVAGILIYMGATRSVKRGAVLVLWTGGLFGLLYVINEIAGTGFSLFKLGLATIVPLVLVMAARVLYAKNYRALKVLAGVAVAIAFTIAVDFAMNHVLKPHQQHRIYVTLGLEDDPQGVGYNVNQSKIAIGSGGFRGKGYLNGTQTKLHFVPEQSTDFIFCTVGEEWGFLGTTFVILLYAGFLLRLVFLAERQRSSFSRIFGYGLIAVLFTHFVINIGMTIGLLPVIGIPLPFFSYGGSSLWAFTMFLFIFLRLDANRLELLR